MTNSIDKKSPEQPKHRSAALENESPVLSQDDKNHQDSQSEIENNQNGVDNEDISNNIKAITQ